MYGLQAIAPRYQEVDRGLGLTEMLRCNGVALVCSIGQLAPGILAAECAL
jgi:ABC-type proline/glycine betaine transport system permease subunit